MLQNLRTVTVIQARTSSTRLPGKALLEVAGYPSAILSVLRAANRGHDTILATSVDQSDDELTRRAESHKLKVFRGPLHDVLQRYYLATLGLPDDYVVIRMTADNVVPDGEFVEALVRAFADANADYLSTGAIESGLPYGLGAEVFTLRALRMAQMEASTPEDREHVGPWIRRNCNSGIYRREPSAEFDYSHLRCTIDDLEDFERITRLFESVAEPVSVSWRALLQRLANLPGEARFRVPYKIIDGEICSNLTLGTVQLGLEYGAVNDSGKPSREQAIEIVRTAISHGVTAVDTARSYGTAEAVLGDALTGSWGSRTRVITKLDLSGLSPDSNAREVRARVDQSVRCSLEALRVSRIAVLLLHRWNDHDAWGGSAWERLLELCDEGCIGSLGASVYEPEQALSAFKDPAVRHLQVPMNVLDWRWEARGVHHVALSRPDVVVHARSVLLQGVLVHPRERWPSVTGFDTDGAIRKLNELANDFRRADVKDLCFAYVRSLPWIASSVVGCETMIQLKENLRLSRTGELTAEQCQRLRAELPGAPEELLNPSKWGVLNETRASR